MKNLLCLILFIILSNPHYGLTSYVDGGPLPVNQPAQEPSANLYSFRIGAAAEGQSGYRRQFGIPVTGARVEIMITSKGSVRGSQLSYWVGVDLSDEGVVRVGYLVNLTMNGAPSWFWAYSRAGASEIVQVGSIVGRGGDWIRFSLTCSGTTWNAYVDDSEVGSINVGVSEAGGPYAVAEVSPASSVGNELGPVEFRDLAYRDANSNWQSASSGVTICSYKVGSTLSQSNLPYGVTGVPGEDNHWIVGSHIPFMVEGQRLWPWYYVKVTSDYGSTVGSGWYVKGNLVSPQATSPFYAGEGRREILTRWLVNGRLTAGSRFMVDTNLTLRASYKTQFFLGVTSQLGERGSDWYDDGTPAQYSTITSPQSTFFAECEWIFDGWYEKGKQLSGSTSGSIIMDAPHTMEGRWRIACRNCSFGDLCAASIGLWYSVMGMIPIILFTIMLLFAFRIAGKSTRLSNIVRIFKKGRL